MLYLTSYLCQFFSQLLKQFNCAKSRVNCRCIGIQCGNHDLHWQVLLFTQEFYPAKQFYILVCIEASGFTLPLIWRELWYHLFPIAKFARRQLQHLAHLAYFVIYLFHNKKLFAINYFAIN